MKNVSGKTEKLECWVTGKVLQLLTMKKWQIVIVMSKIITQMVLQK